MGLYVDIKKRLGSFALDVRFETEGETMALLGASGCGKSLTLRCIAGIEMPDSGRIELNGRVLFDSEARVNLTPQQRRVGYLFQQFALFPNMTVRQNVAAGVRKEKSARRDAIVSEKLRAFHIEELADRRPNQLSGGQQQRAALARILANEPELLLLDEPFTALDSYLKWQLELELADTLASFGRGAVYVSHDRDEVYRLCDSVCVLSNGKSEAKQRVSELFERPRTVASCLLSGCKNISRAEKRGGHTVFASDWGCELKCSESVGENVTHVGVRAHYLRSSGGSNAVRCTVERVVEEPFATTLMLRPESGSSLLRSSFDKGGSAKIGDGLTVYIDPQDVMPLA